MNKKLLDINLFDKSNEDNDDIFYQLFSQAIEPRDS